MLDFLIKDGTIVTAFDTYNADIRIENGKIKLISKSQPVSANKILNANGKLVFAGGIDAHTHMSNRYDFFGTFGPDNFETGSASAACGGITTFLDFARQVRGQTLAECLKLWREEADSKVAIDYGIHPIITDVNKNVLEEIPQLVDSGVPSFKMYMTYRDSLMVDDGRIVEAMRAIAIKRGLIGLHCENNDLVELARKNFQPRDSYIDGVPAIFAEEEAVQRAALFAKHMHCRMYVVHLSTELGLEAVRRSASTGVEVFSETCPHYLTFTDEVYSREDWPIYTVAPPIRRPSDRDALWAGLANGEIKIVASDNAGRNMKDKMGAKDDLSKMPVGISGIEVIIPILYTLGVRKERISLTKLVEVTSYNPAVLFGLFPRKGVIAVDSDADIVIFDPKKTMPLSVENLHSKVDHSVYEEITAEGTVLTTMSKGVIVYNDGQFLGRAGEGKYIPRFLI